MFSSIENSNYAEDQAAEDEGLVEMTKTKAPNTAKNDSKHGGWLHDVALENGCREQLLLRERGLGPGGCSERGGIVA